MKTSKYDRKYKTKNGKIKKYEYSYSRFYLPNGIESDYAQQEMQQLDLTPGEYIKFVIRQRMM